MNWPPVSSEESAELRELEQAEAARRTSTTDASRLQPHRCVDGWLDEDDQGRPRPCLLCRPHLTGLSDGRVVERSSLVRHYRDDPRLSGRGRLE